MFLLVVTGLFIGLCLGFFLGRNLNASPILVTQVQESPVPTAASLPTQSPLVNINQANLYELMTLPGIGEVLAQRMIDYRSTNGPFGSLAELMYVEGIGEQKLEELLPYITTGG